MADRRLPPGLIVSAPRSGAGKTTVTLGLLRALRDAGRDVQPFKCGPDYIDPAFHAAAAGRPSCNLDTWAMSDAMIAGLLTTAADTDLCLAEGAMGLFDGVAVAGACGNGSSADLASLTGWPVVLVLDISGQAQSAAAVALGFARFRADVTLAGVILNRVASPRHEAMARDGFDRIGIPVLGAVPRDEAVSLPERHLGLVQAAEHADLEHRLQALAALMGKHVDLAALTGAAVRGEMRHAPAPNPALRPPGQRIALARDAAFSFIYPHLIDTWRMAGAEILPFSPLDDQSPDPAADVVWLPGGYPEHFAGRLAAAARFKGGLRRHAETRHVHGECGGYMVLGQTLIDAGGTAHHMAGLLGLVTSFAARKMHLGYRRADLLHPIPAHAAGTALRGHEFHYSTVIDQPDPPLARVTDAAGVTVPETGSRRGTVTGTFFHLIAEAS